MPLKRFCAACDAEIPPTRYYLDVVVRVMKPEDSDDQDQVMQRYNDFCLACCRSGRAIGFLLSQIEKKIALDVDRVEEVEATKP